MGFRHEGYEFEIPNITFVSRAARLRIFHVYRLLLWNKLKLERLFIGREWVLSCYIVNRKLRPSLFLFSTA